jgi:predicted lipoprotein with Yx(FWY)xxD motif
MPRAGRATGCRSSAGRRQISVAAVVSAVVALGVVGFAAAASAAARATTTSTVSTATTADLGPVLTAGTTVYTLEPSGTRCAAKCLAARPPVLLARGHKTATAGAGVDGSKLGTARAGHGARQLTYGGKRLYWSVKDTAAGQVHGTGHDTWGTWSAVPLATAITTAPPATEAPTTAPPAAPATAPATAPETAPAETSPPPTDPPAPKTDPPAPKTSPPTNPGTGGVAF